MVTFFVITVIKGALNQIKKPMEFVDFKGLAIVLQIQHNLYQRLLGVSQTSMMGLFCENN